MIATDEKLSLMDNLLSDFEIHQNEILHGNSSAIIDIKKAAIQSFETLGIPTKKNEEWKYSNIAEVFKNEWVQFPAKTHSLSEDEIVQYAIPKLESHRIVTLNGNYIPSLSDKQLPDFVTVTSLSEALTQKNTTAEKHFSKHADFRSEAFTALSTAFTKDGLFIHISENGILQKPIHIISLIDSDEELLVHPRNLFVFEKNSQGSIIESQHSTSSPKENRLFSNSVNEVVCGENAQVSLYQVQDDKNKNLDRISTLAISQSGSSIFRNTSITIRGNFTRNNISAMHGGEGCETHLYGMYHLIDRQHLDNHTLIDHKMPNCFSNELYLGILDNASTGVFNGKVHVRKDAQKTNAFQSNKNVLLTDEAKMNSKPQLEIYADDVKCSHGATTGQIDKEALFYLRSRGLSAKKAKSMLMFAFVKEVLDSIPIEALKEQISTELTTRLGN